MKLLHRNTHGHCFSASLRALLLLSFCALNAPGQSPQRQDLGPQDASKSSTRTNTKTASKPPPDVSRWRSLLDQSRSEANALAAEAGRPFALAEVADAYWDIDKATAEGLFTSAMEAARSLGGKNKQAGEAAAEHVLTLAARRSGSLAKSLTKLGKSNAEEAQSNAQAGSEAENAALNLLKSDPKQAAQLMKAKVSAGPSMGAAWLIFQIAERDPAAGEGLYRAYLDRFRAGANQGLEQLLWLGGYPFGYGEAYGGAKDTTQFVGFGGFRIKGLTANPPLAAAFLDLAFQNVYSTIQQAASSPDTEGELLNGLAAFAAGYWLPEVERYRPETLSAWYSLYQMALNGVTQSRRAAVVEHLQRIMKVRSAAASNKTPEEYVSEQTEEALERAESLPGGCERDRLYAQAVLNLNYTKGFTRSLELAKKIKDDSVARGVVQYVYYDIATKAIEAGDAVEGDRYAELVGADELRTLLHLKAARAALGRKDSTLAGQSIRKAVNTSERISDPDVRASALLAAAEIYASFDLPEALVLLRGAVKAINRLPHYKGGAPVLRKVDLNCGGAANSWYGSFEQMGRSSLFEILSLLAPRDAESALSVAYSLEDPAAKVRALAAIAKAELAQRPAARAGAAP